MCSFVGFSEKGVWLDFSRGVAIRFLLGGKVVVMVEFGLPPAVLKGLFSFCLGVTQDSAGRNYMGCWGFKQGLWPV